MILLLSTMFACSTTLDSYIILTAAAVCVCARLYTFRSN